MNSFKIVMPKINSTEFFVNKRGASENKFNFPAAKLKEFISTNKIEELSYGTKDGLPGFSNFTISCKNSLRPKIEATEQKLVELKNGPLIANVSSVKKQVVEEFASFMRKITTVTKFNKKEKTVYKTEQVLTKDNFYKVLRTKNGEFVSGYECYLDDISKTAKSYTKKMFKNLISSK